MARLTPPRRRTETGRTVQVARTTLTKVQKGFLGEASAVLASSFDYKQNLTTVARLAVPLLADACVTDLLEEGGRTHRLEARGDEKPGRLPSGLDALRAEVLRNAVPVLLNGQGREPRASRRGAGGPADALGTNWKGSLVVTPLLGRGRTIGTVTLAFLDAHRHYSTRDLAFTQALAGQASLAIRERLARSEGPGRSRGSPRAGLS